MRASCVRSRTRSTGAHLFSMLLHAESVWRSTAFVSGEGSFPVVNDGFFAGGKPHFHDIETDGDAAVQKAQPVAGTAAQQFAFSPVHSPGRRTMSESGITFYLDEYQYIAITAHDIYLTGIAPAEVTPQHTEPLCTQP